MIPGGDRCKCGVLLVALALILLTALHTFIPVAFQMLHITGGTGNGAEKQSSDEIEVDMSICTAEIIPSLQKISMTDCQIKLSAAYIVVNKRCKPYKDVVNTCLGLDFKSNCAFHRNNLEGCIQIVLFNEMKFSL